MSEASHAAIVASFCADSLSLGPHWDYDSRHIADTLGRVDRLLPPATQFHQGKHAGDFTHYGDQTLVLLESVAAKKQFDLDDFFSRWKALFESYDGYVDSATRMTRQRIEFGEGPQTSGSASNDLAGASRMAPLLAVYADNPSALIAAAKAQTAMTHKDPEVIWAADFFARTVLKALAGTEPVAAMQAAAAELPGDAKKVVGWVEEALSMLSEDPVKAAARFGLSCHVDEAFPATVQVIAHSPDDLKTCLVDCVMAAGDMAARAMLAGMVVAAYPKNGGMQAIPQEWLNGLRQKDAILNMLQQIV